MRALVLAAIALGSAAANAATFTFVSRDAAGEGLNDPTPFTPEGGNTATTLGAARMAVLQEAGRVWGQQLSSNVTITVEASFDPLACTATTATLGSTGPAQYFANVSGLPMANVAYPSALAKAIIGNDAFSRGTTDISAQFSSSVIGSPSCLNGRRYYLGLDHGTNGVLPSNTADLLNTALHELAHGLGFVSIVGQNGQSRFSSGRLTIFDQFIYYESLGRFWSTMTAAERASAVVSGTALAWNGASTNSSVGLLTAGRSSPSGLAELYAPANYDDGSSVSHWHTNTSWIVAGVSRSLLMEPFITANPFGLTDFTGCVLRDIGWQGTRCVDAQSANSTPVALAQTVAVAGDTPTGITLRGTDPDSSTLTYAIVSPPARGTLVAPASLSGTNGVVFTYFAGANAAATDSFSFQVNDGQSTSVPATVTLNITAINHPPVATAQSVTVQINRALVIALGGSDADGNSLSYSVVGVPAHGVLSGTAPNLTYTPGADFVGADSFQFTVNDGVVDSAAATVSISVISGSAAVVSQPATPGGAGGGGGSLDWLGLALLLASVSFRCTPGQRAQSWGEATLRRSPRRGAGRHLRF